MYQTPDGTKWESRETADLHMRVKKLEEAAEGIDATDAARDLADAEGVDLESVTGTGTDGRLVSDVRDHIAAQGDGDGDGDGGEGGDGGDE